MLQYYFTSVTGVSITSSPAWRTTKYFPAGRYAAFSDSLCHPASNQPPGVNSRTRLPSGSISATDTIPGAGSAKRMVALELNGLG